MNKSLKSFYGPIEDESLLNIIELAVKQSKKVFLYIIISNFI